MAFLLARALTPWARLHCDGVFAVTFALGSARSLRGRVFTATRRWDWPRRRYSARSLRGRVFTATGMVGLTCLLWTRAHSVGASSLRREVSVSSPSDDRALTPWARLHCDHGTAATTRANFARSLRGRVFTATTSG